MDQTHEDALNLLTFLLDRHILLNQSIITNEQNAMQIDLNRTRGRARQAEIQRAKERIARAERARDLTIRMFTEEG